jgi:hypothetical protein
MIHSLNKALAGLGVSLTAAGCPNELGVIRAALLSNFRISPLIGLFAKLEKLPLRNSCHFDQRETILNEKIEINNRLKQIDYT